MLDKDSWRFELAGDQVVAIAVGQARYADLADGSLGEGIAGAGDTVDITPLFPAWVKQVLAAQVKTGWVLTQSDPTREPTGYNGLDHDLGYGNCHGFTSKLFEVLDKQALSSWKMDDQPDTSTAPAGAPLKMEDADPSYQHVQMLIGKEAGSALRAWGQKYEISNKYPARWVAAVELGRNLFLQRILSMGVTAVAAPRLGDLGITSVSSKGFLDHSLVALGLAGATGSAGNAQRIYTLQKMHPLGVYAVCAWRMTDYDWYRFPRRDHQTGDPDENVP